MDTQELRRLLAEALHDANHVDEKRLNSQRSQLFLNECGEKIKKASKVLKGLYER